ncbi:MAG: M3 family oligoendopeptidase [Treponema sp.]|nr:M3 family oligoendopeptidase [Treponema sp.]
MPAGIRPLPRWDLRPIYPSFDSPEYREDRALLGKKIAALLKALESPLPKELSAGALLSLIRLYEEAGDIGENLSAYAEAVYTTDTRDGRALAEINALEAEALPLGKAVVLFRQRLAERKEDVLALLEPGAAGAGEALRSYGFFIRESLEKAAFQMTADLEDLANDLARSGGEAWRRLQEAISSTASVLWDPPGGERKTITSLRDLAHNPDRAIRERAYRAELAAWKAMEIPLAASLNGVKGTAITVDRRRGWESALRKSLFQSRLSEGALGALMAAMESSLPLFRRYLKAKAALLGIKVCAFYDLFAPPGGGPAGAPRAAGAEAPRGQAWSWEEAAGFIADRFSAFDPAMGDFARRAFARSWIDAQGREGKVGGAYCTDFPLAGESRILCNFEGSFDSVTTVAHELGHAWHHEVIKDLPRSLSRYPMTLAETASIFAETIVFEGALKNPAAGMDRLGLIEGNLKDSCQVIVDILSRFYFERKLFECRDRAELSPEELCALMTEAQKETYGEGLDPEKLHPYMWAVKSHYYSPGLAFYNYPYAFGLLFSLGLYARAQREGPGFAGAYRGILRLTGQASAGEVARSAGFDIEGEEFWQTGVELIARRVAEFEKLVQDNV